MSDSILQVNLIKDKGGNATGITVADSTANVTIGNLTHTAGSIGSAVTINTQDYIVAKLSTIQTLTHATETTLAFATEVHDPNNWFDTSTYKFTPNKAGKYFFSLCVTIYANQGVANNEISKIYVYKNTSMVSTSVIDARSTSLYNVTNTCTGVVDLNGSSDYVITKAQMVDVGGNGTGQVDNAPTLLSIFRIGS